MELNYHDRPSKEIISHFESHWNSTTMVLSGESIDLMHYPIIVARDPALIGVLSYRIAQSHVEILSLASEKPGHGVGKLLLDALEKVAKINGCEAIHLITTNDNMTALHFYQKHGYYIKELYPEAVDLSRILKPEIPLTFNSISIRDELRLVKNLRPEMDFFYRNEVFHVKPSISLQPFETIALADIIRLFSDPKVFRYQAMQPFKTLTEASVYHHKICRQIRQRTRLARGIYVNDDFAGIISLHQIQKDRCALGYSLSPKYWNKGIATESAIAMIRIAIDHMKIRRIEAITHPDNIASIRLLERLHFHQEGTLVEYLLNPRTQQYENREAHALLAKNFR